MPSALTTAVVIRHVYKPAMRRRVRFACGGPSSDPVVLCEQQFVDACFERAGSTQRALRLLRQFQTVLGRESSRAHLDEKYAAIFVRYTADLEGVRTTVEAGRHRPLGL